LINDAQADAIIIQCPDGNHQLFIDAGELDIGFRYTGSVVEFAKIRSSITRIAKANKLTKSDKNKIFNLFMFDSI